MRRESKREKWWFKGEEKNEEEQNRGTGEGEIWREIDK